MNLPEYPQRPAAHLKSPTAINIRGRTTHCDVELRADQSKEAKGYVGWFPLVRLAVGDVGVAIEASLSLKRAFLDRCPRGLCGEGEGPAIVTDDMKRNNIQCAYLSLEKS
jgi:hypothetical protein